MTSNYSLSPIHQFFENLQITRAFNAIQLTSMSSSLLFLRASPAVPPYGVWWRLFSPVWEAQDDASPMGDGFYPTVAPYAPTIQPSMQPGKVDPEAGEELTEAGGRSLRTRTSSSSPKAREACCRLLELPKRLEVVAEGPTARAHKHCHAPAAQALPPPPRAPQGLRSGSRRPHRQSPPATPCSRCAGASSGQPPDMQGRAAEGHVAEGHHSFPSCAAEVGVLLGRRREKKR
jgi:hypothetical protein